MGIGSHYPEVSAISISFGTLDGCILEKSDQNNTFGPTFILQNLMVNGDIRDGLELAILFFSR